MKTHTKWILYRAGVVVAACAIIVAFGQVVDTQTEGVVKRYTRVTRVVQDIDEDGKLVHVTAQLTEFRVLVLTNGETEVLWQRMRDGYRWDKAALVALGAAHSNYVARTELFATWAKSNWPTNPPPEAP